MFRKKNNKLIVFFNNRDIVSLIESCCGQSTAIQNKVNREAVGEKTAPLKKLNNEYLNISLSFSFPFGFVFNYKIFARTDIATNKMQIHVTLKICNTRSDSVFRYSCKLGTCTDTSQFNLILFNFFIIKIHIQWHKIYARHHDKFIQFGKCLLLQGILTFVRDTFTVNSS